MLVKYQNDKIENQHDNPRRLRGMALIVAILIVLVLSGLSLVALQAASNRLHLAGTARIATVAKSVAASGVEGTLALAGHPRPLVSANWCQQLTARYRCQRYTLTSLIWRRMDQDPLDERSSQCKVPAGTPGCCPC